jgi:hypothetical protein
MLLITPFCHICPRFAARLQVACFANAGGSSDPIAKAAAVLLPLANAEPLDASAEWIEIPFGDVPNVYESREVVQRLDRPAAEALVQRFGSWRGKLARLFGGVPFYVGHPDHPSFANVDQDRRAYGWIKDLALGESGLRCRVDWSAAGQTLLANAHYKWWSPLFLGMPTGQQVDGKPLYTVAWLKSAGLTNNPRWPVAPLANEFDPSQARDESGKWSSGGVDASDRDAFVSEVEAEHKKQTGYSYEKSKIAEAADRGIREDDVLTPGGQKMKVGPGGVLTMDTPAGPKSRKWAELTPQQQRGIRKYSAMVASRKGIHMPNEDDAIADDVFADSAVAEPAAAKPAAKKTATEATEATEPAAEKAPSLAERIREALGLAADVADDQIVAAIGALHTAVTSMREAVAQLTPLANQVGTVAAERDAARAAMAEIKFQAGRALVDAAIVAGRVLPADLDIFVSGFANAADTIAFANAASSLATRAKVLKTSPAATSSPQRDSQLRQRQERAIELANERMETAGCSYDEAFAWLRKEHASLFVTDAATDAAADTHA